MSSRLCRLALWAEWTLRAAAALPPAVPVWYDPLCTLCWLWTLALSPLRTLEAAPLFGALACPALARPLWLGCEWCEWCD